MAVEGKRKVWGTLKTTTVTAVKNAIKVISKIDGLEVKRKYQLSRADRVSVGSVPKVQVSRWWFVISGDETTLDKLARNWSAIKLQTN